MRARRWIGPALAALAICGWVGRGALRPATGHSVVTPVRMAGPRRGDRLLIIAPHCDDESVACGGLIQQARAAGAQIRVVIITNGDAFRVAAERLFHTTDVTPDEYISMGRQRQEESLAALAGLGVSARQVVFLGYPDGGTAWMWLDRWESPYASTRTQTDHSPYANSLRRDAPYRGRSLVDDLKSAIAQFRPTLVALPHPADKHSDHWAASCYGTAALYELGLWGKMKTLLYLLHEMDYPYSDPLPPPREPEAWKALQLSPSQQEAKHKAISCYRTQLPVLGRFMMEFAAPVEWYCEARPQELRQLAQGDAVDWRSVPPALSDPPDREGATPPSGDITSLRVCRVAHDLRVLIEFRVPASPEITYGLHLHALGKDRVSGPMNYVLTPGKESRGITAKATGHGIEVALPWSADHVGVMLNADTHGEGKAVDRTRWVTLTTR